MDFVRLGEILHPSMVPVSRHNVRKYEEAATSQRHRAFTPADDPTSPDHGARAVTEREALIKAVDDLETALQDSQDLADANFKENRKEGINLRRLIAEKVAAVGALGGHAFKETAQADAFRREFSSMRSALAYHQASWPIVSIDHEDQSYLDSVRSLRERNIKFIDWVRTALTVS